jgi:hypothetical protein
MTYITTYPQVAPMSLTVHRQHCIRYEDVFMSLGRDHKTSLGLHALGARSWLVARQTHNSYRTIETVLKQASS